MPIIGNQPILKVSKKPRKQRQPKACYPCRQRKVKCDGVPCSSCALRSHPELCSMEPYSNLESCSESFEHSTNSSSMGTVSENTAQETLHISDGDPRAGARRALLVSRAESTDAPGLVADGQSSSILPLPSISPDIISDYNAIDPSIQRTSSYEGGQASLTVDNSTVLTSISPASTPQPLHRTWSENLFELIGDGEDIVLPFEDLYSPRKSIADLCLALPSNDQIQRYFQMYTHILLPIYPGLVDPELFDAQLRSLLANRDQVITNANNISSALNHQDASWFALLFAVIACGAQCISTIDREAELNSKVFGTISFSCLRKVNYLTNPSMNSIQALLNIGISLRNDMHSSVAWSLLGLTIRHAQVIGCCEVHATPMNRNASDDDSHNAKLRLWWAIVWQDVTLSFCYGRPCGSLSARAQFPPILDPNGRYSFTDVINRVCGVCHDFCRQELSIEEADKSLPQTEVEKLVQRMEDIHLKAQPHLLHIINCISPRQHIEYFAVTIYKNHAAANLLKSIIPAPSTEDSDASYHPVLCKLTEMCVAIVESFLKLRQFSILSSHYWSLIQATITAAKFLLTQGRGIDRLKWGSLVRSLTISLGSSYDGTTNTRSGFSANLSKLVTELSMLLDT